MVPSWRSQDTAGESAKAVSLCPEAGRDLDPHWCSPRGAFEGDGGLDAVERMVIREAIQGRAAVSGLRWAAGERRSARG
jgi:hypothetical protein